MRRRIVFRLKRLWKIKLTERPKDDVEFDLYEAIKAGQKTSEFRDYTNYWEQRLCPGLDEPDDPELEFQKLPTLSTIDITKFLKPKIAWFTVGYPKNNLPRLEADIIKLLLHLDSDQFEIQFQNVKEVTA